MKVYSPSEVAKLLNIKMPTLRKYSILLEKHGYRIERNSQGHRYYRDKDVMTLRNVITGTKSGVTLEESIHTVVNLEGHNTITNVTNNGDEANRNDIAELKELIHKQNDLIKGLTERLDQQQEYIEKRINERDQVLMQSIKEIMESKKQIAATEIEKKGFFSRLFNGRDK